MECPKIESRSADGATVLTGLAIPYDSWSQPIYGYFKEKFQRGAFQDQLASNPDIVCSVDHDWGKILGRTSSRTLVLLQQDDGIYVECTIPNTTYARDLSESVSRKDIRGMSFTFDSIDEDWGKEDGKSYRSVKKAKLYEVCFTSNPAYLATSAGLRNMNVYSEEAAKEMLRVAEEKLNPAPQQHNYCDEVLRRRFYLATGTKLD